MFHDPMFLLILVALVCVLVILATGVIGFARGGEFNRKHGNRMMRWRLIAQFIALCLIMASLWFQGR